LKNSKEEIRAIARKLFSQGSHNYDESEVANSVASSLPNQSFLERLTGLDHELKVSLSKNSLYDAALDPNK